MRWLQLQHFYDLSYFVVFNTISPVPEIENVPEGSFFHRALVNAVSVEWHHTAPTIVGVPVRFVLGQDTAWRNAVSAGGSNSGRSNRAIVNISSRVTFWTFGIVWVNVSVPRGYAKLSGRWAGDGNHRVNVIENNFMEAEVLLDVIPLHILNGIFVRAGIRAVIGHANGKHILGTGALQKYSRGARSARLQTFRSGHQNPILSVI